MQLRAKLAAATLAATVIGGGALMPTFAERGAGEQPPVGIQAGEADRRRHQRADDRHGHLRPERRLPPVALGLAGPDDQREGVLRLELPGRSNGGWVCNGKPQTLNITAFQSNAQPPFHKGAAVAVFYLSGADANGNYFSYSKRVNVSIT